MLIFTLFNFQNFPALIWHQELLNMGSLGIHRLLKLCAESWVFGYVQYSSEKVHSLQRIFNGIHISQKVNNHCFMSSPKVILVI